MQVSSAVSDYAQRFGGLARLYGADALPRLRAARVCVVGIGGVGSWAVEALARSGIGAITVIDLDDVCVTNINRQIHALDGQVGRPKVEAIAERVRLINPECALVCTSEFFTQSTADRLLGEHYDFVVDCTDRLTNKCLLIAGCRDRALPVLTVGGAGGRRDSTEVRVADLAHAKNDELFRQVRRKLRRDFGFPLDRAADFGVLAVFSPEKPMYAWKNGTCSPRPEPGTRLNLDCETGFGTASFVTGAFGFAAAGEVVRRIALERVA
jgi:tRNA A37 threonylcarbamoyladenosine dehydratase